MFACVFVRVACLGVCLFACLFVCLVVYCCFCLVACVFVCLVGCCLCVSVWVCLVGCVFVLLRVCVRAFACKFLYFFLATLPTLPKNGVTFWYQFWGGNRTVPDAAHSVTAMFI